MDTYIFYNHINGTVLSNNAELENAIGYRYNKLFVLLIEVKPIINLEAGSNIDIRLEEPYIQPLYAGIGISALNGYINKSIINGAISFSTAEQRGDIRLRNSDYWGAGSLASVYGIYLCDN